METDESGQDPLPWEPSNLSTSRMPLPILALFGASMILALGCPKLASNSAALELIRVLIFFERFFMALLRSLLYAQKKLKLGKLL